MEELIIEAGRTEKKYWKDLWRYRELFYILSWRDIKVRYKQTVIGAAWSIIRPLLTMIVFTVIFSRVAKMPAGLDAPYAILVYAGMLPWTFFSSSLSEASGSLIGNTNLISKVYFPRLIIPAATVITSLVDFAISFVLMLGLFVWYQYSPGWQMLLLPLFLLLAFIASLGIGLYLTAMNVKFRDFRYIVPFIVQFGLYISPVGFNSNNIPEKWRLLYALNPMVGVIDGFRWCLLNGQQHLYWDTMLISLSVSLIFLWIGIRQFRKMEKSFADLI
ncbi:ABC transporter permease [Agriterribacter sp.]|uniref:ABC transporter permease n=1 Tax=Agriterribacter sp. TaxID=2821509 RepID=UPI002B804300|nr:ABC transporter permease [Agriterribacter sp.]HTN06096.1 ABC transporter permease [Agriterribacter sp.]